MADAFAPRWAGGWAAARVCFGIAALDAQIARFPNVQDALAAPTFVFASGPMRIADEVLLSAPAAWALWAFGFVAVAGILAGGRWAKPGVAVWYVAYVALIACLGLNFRVPERFVTWAVAGLLLAPIGEPRLHEKWRSPAARWYLMIVYSGLYGSTGWLKLVVERSWWTGDALRYDLVDRFHAGGALATWLSGQPLLCAAMSWYTIAFEASFPLLVWWAPATPWLLLGGVGMHVGIGALMDVGVLGTMAMALYPALLDPDRAHALWQHVPTRWRRLAEAA
ncbi:MAG: hypothetical protein ACOZNI_33435 [Myxococcota bacterium]